MQIAVEIPGDRKVIKKAAEEILKYKSLIIEIQHVWNVKAKVVPGKTGGDWNHSKITGQYLSNVPGKHEIKKLQKTDIFGTAHKLRQVLM